MCLQTGCRYFKVLGTQWNSKNNNSNHFKITSYNFLNQPKSSTFTSNVMKLKFSNHSPSKVPVYCIPRALWCHQHCIHKLGFMLHSVSSLMVYFLQYKEEHMVEELLIGTKDSPRCSCHCCHFLRNIFWQSITLLCLQQYICKCCLLSQSLCYLTLSSWQSVFWTNG